MNRLTLRPQFPKSCREFATTSIPSHIIVLISTSSYSSVTVGRKKTSLPRGLSIAREKRTRSETSSESSYGFVGGIYCWSVLLRRWQRLEGMKTQRNAETRNPRAAVNVWTRSVTDSRGFFLPSRFAPARTPSMRGDKRGGDGPQGVITYRVGPSQWRRISCHFAKGVG